MASDTDDFDQNIENLKSTVRQSFARLYAALKARELKTLRQLDALRKQCQDNKDLKGSCVQNIRISYENESTILNNVSSYGLIDLEKLNFDSNTFILEDYFSPNDDHLYSYKTIEELTKEEDTKDLEAIEEAALKEITKNDDCVCIVTIQKEEVSKKFRDFSRAPVVKFFGDSEEHNGIDLNDKDDTECVEKGDTGCVEKDGTECVEKEAKEINVGSESSDEEIKKLGPTDDWLNSIKNQTEIEPSQVTDGMEHSTIACS